MSDGRFKITAIGHRNAWTGVIKDARTNETLWSCGHLHQNRDHSSPYNYAAKSCAHAHLDAATNPEFGKWLETCSWQNPPHPTTVKRIRAQQARASEVRKALKLGE